MKRTETGFVPMLFAHDINVYSVARAFHEAYGVPSHVFCKAAGGPCRDSAIIAELVCDPRMDTREKLLDCVRSFAKAHPDKTVFALGCGDSYVKLLSQCRAELPSNVIAPYIDPELMERLIHKERFYQLCEELSLDYPATVVFRSGDAPEAPFGPPYILKPSNGVAYWEHPFPDQKKVFTLNTWPEVLDTARRVFEAGYDDSLILQEFVPGDDSYMRVMTCYSNREGQVCMTALGHVLLEEHTPHGIGNHAVILNESHPELEQRIKALLEGLGYIGFSNFDIKYDERDGRYKLFEINLRQGRSNFYVTGAGCNIARLLVEEYVEHKPLEPVTVSERRLWRVVPKRVLFRYIQPQYHDELKRLIREGKSVNPLFYAKDLGPRRLLRQLVGLLRQNRNYKRYGQPACKRS